MTLTDDDLGARLRSALQQVTALATDPVPPPRFIVTAAAPTAAQAVASPVEADVLELGAFAAAPGRPGRRRHHGHRGRRRALAGMLVAAAVAAGVLVATTDAGGPAPTATPAGPVAPTGFSEQLTAPPTGAVRGWFVAPEIVRCEAPAGATLGASHATDVNHTDIWTVAAGVTCRTMPAERGRYLFDPPRARDAADQPAHIEGSQACLVASTRVTGTAPFRAYGNGDYLEFYGASCLIRSASR